MEPRLEEAKKGERNVYFSDAAHFVHGAFLGMIWCFVKLFIKSPSGRQRFNVLGALNAVTHQLVTITNETYINSMSVCELLEKIANIGHTKPITLILDNAKYQKCKLVQERALELGIELLFLPPYSPNLNLIERLWKFTKNECLNCRYYGSFAEFRESISSFLDNLDSQKTKLDSLLTFNFQTFDNILIS